MLRRRKDGEVAGTELAKHMLVDLLKIACSNDEADGEAVVGSDLQLVTFLARSFQITGIRIDDVGGDAETSIVTKAVQHALSLINGEDGSASLICVVFGNGWTAYVSQKGHNLFYKL